MRFLVEEYLPGNEFTVAIIGNPFYLETRVLEEDLEDEGMISQRVKWDPDHFKGTHSKYPEFSLEAQETAVIHSLRMFREFGCRDYARIDWRLDRFGKPKLMEVNPNCGVSDDSHLSIAYMLGEEQSVMCYASNVLYKILRAAEMRFSRMKYEKK